MSAVLFYDRDHGAGALADVAANKLTTLRSYGAGSFGHWSHVVSRGSTLLFYLLDTGAAAIGIVTGSTFATTKTFAAGSRPDGSVRAAQRSVGTALGPSAAFHVVSDRRATP